MRKGNLEARIAELERQVLPPVDAPGPIEVRFCPVCGGKLTQPARMLPSDSLTVACRAHKQAKFVLEKVRENR